MNTLFVKLSKAILIIIFSMSFTLAYDTDLDSVITNDDDQWVGKGTQHERDIPPSEDIKLPLKKGVIGASVAVSAVIVGDCVACHGYCKQKGSTIDTCTRLITKANTGQNSRCNCK